MGATEEKKGKQNATHKRNCTASSEEFLYLKLSFVYEVNSLFSNHFFLTIGVYFRLLDTQTARNTKEIVPFGTDVILS